MDFESPVILVDLNLCYLPYDHKVRLQIRKLGFAERKRQECRQARNQYKDGPTGLVKLAFQKEFFRFEDLA